MAILDDLLTIDDQWGKKLSHPAFDNRSFLARLRDKPIEPEYCLHRTVAGLPLVLPRRKSGQLYTSIGDRAPGVSVLDHWRMTPIVLPGGFYLDATAESKQSDSIQLSTQVRKPFSGKPRGDYYEGITIAHTLTSEGEMLAATIGYNFDQGRQISFTVYREEKSVFVKMAGEFLIKFIGIADGKVGPRIEDTHVQINGLLDYESTLRNLVEISMKDTVPPEDLSRLYNFHYFVPQAPTSEATRNIKLLN